MPYTKIEKEGYTLYQNENGKTIGTIRNRIIEQDGYAFKDAEGDGILYPYEGWRLSSEKRAKDLAGRLSVKEMIGLTLHTSSQPIPAMPGQMENVGTYGGVTYPEAKDVKPSELTDQQEKMVEKDFIRHFLVSNMKDVETTVEWSNRMQSLAEACPHGIPVNLSSDPRHGADGDRVEFRNASGEVSAWPEGMAMAAVHDMKIARDYAETVAREYRALGIATALGPQIDLGSDPRWFRIQDTFGSDVELTTELARTVCDGLQTTEGEADGWGRDSVIAMAKHWPGGGTGEGGRDAHYPFGKYAVYPGNNFETHLKPFVEGAFRLKGKTGSCAAVMPYYNVPWNQDKKYHENVGNSYNKYIIQDLLIEKYGYEGVICTDWGITKDKTPHVGMYVMGGKCHGVEHLTQAERVLKLIENGVNQFGGLDDRSVVDDAYKLGCEKHGRDYMDGKLYLSAYKLLLNLFRLGLFDQPYLDVEESKQVVGCEKYVRRGLNAQKKSPVLLKNKNQAFPLAKKARVYIPMRHIDSYYGFVRMKTKPEDRNPVRDELVNQYFIRVDSPEKADAAVVFVDSPRGRNGYEFDMMAGENQKNPGYYPISLQYRPYTARLARERSIAGGDPRETDFNRSYKDRIEVTANESDLDLIIYTKQAMQEKPVIVVLRMERPTVVREWEAYADAVLVDFGMQKKVIFELLSGEVKPSGKLPVLIPKDMETVETHCEDVANDIEAYIDEMGNIYSIGFGLS